MNTYNSITDNDSKCVDMRFTYIIITLFNCRATGRNLIGFNIEYLPQTIVNVTTA